jgi:dTDP-4-dehydrorhamnose 3,5-epimerase
MRIDWTAMAGVVIEPAERHRDERGSFEKLYHGSPDHLLTVSQVCTSFNRTRGTVRGLHVQLPPNEEQKALWCSAGAMFDVVVDTRRGSKSFGHWAGIDLEASEPVLLRIPPGIAHGYQTLTDDTAVTYLINGEHVPDAARTVLWNDPSLGIEWPLDVSIISAADRAGQRWPVS